MDRVLTPFIQQDLKKKMVFLTGPRQAGKTTLAQQLAKAHHQPRILTCDHTAGDILADQRIIQQHGLRPNARWSSQSLVFEEPHKSRTIDPNMWQPNCVLTPLYLSCVAAPNP